MLVEGVDLLMGENVAVAGRVIEETGDVLELDFEDAFDDDDDGGGGGGEVGTPADSVRGSQFGIIRSPSIESTRVGPPSSGPGAAAATTPSTRPPPPQLLPVDSPGPHRRPPDAGRAIFRKSKPKGGNDQAVLLWPTTVPNPKIFNSFCLQGHGGTAVVGPTSGGIKRPVHEDMRVPDIARVPPGQGVHKGPIRHQSGVEIDRLPRLREPPLGGGGGLRPRSPTREELQELVLGWNSCVPSAMMRGGLESKRLSNRELVPPERADDVDGEEVTIVEAVSASKRRALWSVYVANLPTFMQDHQVLVGVARDFVASAADLKEVVVDKERNQRTRVVFTERANAEAFKNHFNGLLCDGYRISTTYPTVVWFE